MSVSDAADLLSPAEAVLTSPDLLPLVWDRLRKIDEDCSARTALTRSQKAIQEVVASFATPSFTTPYGASVPFSIPPPPPGEPPQRRIKLVLSERPSVAVPFQLLDGATGAPWLGSCGATLGSLELHSLSVPSMAAWLQQLSPGLGQVPQLRHLTLRRGRGRGFTLPPHLPPTLTSLTLGRICHHEGDPVSLAALVHLPDLASLTITNCWHANLSTLPALSSLTYLSCRMGPYLSHLSALSCLAELHVLNERSAPLAGLPPLSSVTHLSLRDLRGEIAWAGGAGWASLRELSIDGELAASCHGAADSSVLTLSTTLRSITIKSVAPVRSIVPLLALPHLQALDLDVEGAEGSLEDLTTLTSLRVRWRKRVPQAVCLGRLTRLMELQLVGIRVKGGELAALTLLSHLHLGGCEVVGGLTLHRLSLGTLSRLRKLEVRDCAGLSVLEGLAGMRLLEEVTLTGFEHVTTLDLSGCGNLLRLQLRSCRSLASVDLSRSNPLPSLQGESCPSLRVVRVSLEDAAGRDAVLGVNIGGMDLETARQAVRDAGD